jgi:hypothetical protein
MSAQAAPTPSRRSGPSVWYNLATILLILLLAGVGAAYVIDGLGRYSRHAAEASGETLSRAFGGRTLAIPRAWFRYEEREAEGFAKQIDLRLQLPLGDKGAPATVDITLVPRSRVRPSASLLDGVYLHQFGTEQLASIPGLVGKPLRPDAGYAGEVVWYDPVSPAPFVAKCSAPVDAKAPQSCLRMVYLGPGMAAIYGFSADVLPQWRQFDPLVDERLKQIGAL